MKREDPLISLIGSLTQHEKRYFRLQYSGHFKEKQSHFLRLFELIDSQSMYDEQGLKKRLAGDPLGRQFAVYKNLLYHAILRSLQSYRYEYSPRMRVRSGMDKVEILIEKGKHDAALKMLHRTRNFAEDHGLQGYLLEILNLERRILRFLHPLNYLEFLPTIESYERKIAAMIQQESEAIGIYDRLFAWVQVERRMEKNEFAVQLQAIGGRLADLEQTVVPSFNTIATLLNAKALWRQLQGDYQGMMEAYAALLAHWDGHLHIKNTDPQRYARQQIAWLNSTLAAGKIGQHLQTIRALRKMPIQGFQDRARTVFQSYNLELLWLMDQKDEVAALKFLRTFEQKLPDLLPFLDQLRLNSFYMNAAILYFRGEKYQGALSWSSRLLTKDNPQRDTGLFRSAGLLSLICYCESGKFEAAESQLASIVRRMQSQDADWAFGALVVDAIKRLLPKWRSPDFMTMKTELFERITMYEAQIQPIPLILDLIKDWSQRK